MDEKKREEQLNTEEKKTEKIRGNGFLIASVVFTIITMILVLVFYQSYMKSFREDNNVNKYDQYYVMISSDRKSEFMQGIYKGAFEAGLKQVILGIFSGKIIT